MAKKQIIAIQSGVIKGATDAGKMWKWGKKIKTAGINSSRDRNGGLFVSYGEAKADGQNMGTFYYRELSENGYRVIRHPKDDEPKHPHHYEKGKSKEWVVGADRSGWMYQTKNIHSWSDVQNMKDKILYFYVNGQRDDLYSICWTSFNDPDSEEKYLTYGSAVNDNRYKAVWWSCLSYRHEDSNQSLGQYYGSCNSRKASAPRLRNVAGFTMNCMFNGKDGVAGVAGIYPMTVGLIFQKPGTSALVLGIPKQRASSSLAISQRIDGNDYWGKGDKDNEVRKNLQEEKGTKHTISYYFTKKEIEVIEEEQYEFIGVWWKFGRQGQGAGGTHAWGAFAAWNFRPFVVGPDGALSDTWNAMRYNVVTTERDAYATGQRGIYID